MKKILFLLAMLISVSGMAQTTPWSTSPAVTSQTRTLSGSPQIRWLFGSNLYSIEDSLAKKLAIKDSTSKYITPYFFGHNTGASTQAQINLRELLSNKATTFGILNNILYPTTQAVVNYVTSVLPATPTFQLVTNAGYITTKPAISTDHMNQGDSTSVRTIWYVGDSDGIGAGRADITSYKQGYPYMTTQYMGGINVMRGRSGRRFQQITAGDSSIYSIRDSLPAPKTVKDIISLAVIGDLTGDTLAFTPQLCAPNIAGIITKLISKGWVANQIWFGIPAYENVTTGTRVGYNFYRHSIYAHMLDSVATANGVHFWDGWDPVRIANTLVTPTIWTDSLHMTVYGETIAAATLIASIQAAKPIINYSTSRNSVYGSSYISGNEFIGGNVKINGILSANYTNLVSPWGPRLTFPYNDTQPLDLDDGQSPSSSAYNTLGLFRIIANNRSDINIIQAGTGAPAIRFLVSGGTVTTPTTIANGRITWNLTSQTYDGTAFFGNAGISAAINGAVSAGVMPSKIDISTTATNAAIVAVRVDNDQSVRMLRSLIVGTVVTTAPTAGYVTDFRGKNRFTQTDTWSIPDSIAFHKANGAITLSKLMPTANGGLNIGTNPTANQIPIATNTTSYTPTTISGDITNALGVFNIGANKVSYAKIQAMTANRLLGSGASGTVVAEITLGTNLSFTGTTLNATGGGTLTNFSKVDGYGITSSVANPTTTPVHTIAVDTINITGIATKPYVNNFLTKLSASSIYAKLTDTATFVPKNWASGIYTINGQRRFTGNVSFTGSQVTVSPGNNSIAISSSLISISSPSFGTTQPSIAFSDIGAGFIGYIKSPTSITGNRIWTIQDASGTIALTGDPVSTQTVKDSTTKAANTLYVDRAVYNLTQNNQSFQGIDYFKNLRVTASGVSSDGMGPVHVTMGTAANYAYYGMTRSGAAAMAMGVSTTNDFIWGTGPTRNSGATIDTIQARLNSHTGDWTVNGFGRFGGNLSAVLPAYSSGSNRPVVYNSTNDRFETISGTLTYNHTIFTPTTGSTVNLVNQQYNIINPAAALLTLTVNLPSSPANNDTVYIKFTQTVSTVTYGNGTVVDGITAPTAGGLTVLTYDSGTTSWY